MFWFAGVTETPQTHLSFRRPSTITQTSTFGRNLNPLIHLIISLRLLCAIDTSALCDRVLDSPINKYPVETTLSPAM